MNVVYLDKKDPKKHKKQQHRLKRIVMGLLCSAMLVSSVWILNSVSAEAAANKSKSVSGVKPGVTDVHKAPYSKPSSTPDGEQWQLVLVNGKNPLSKNYVPQLATVGKYQFDKRAADALKQMLADAKAAGLSPVICSAYRSYGKQLELYNNQVAKQQAKGLPYSKACAEAIKVVAYPGTSEHNVGLAVDIVSKGYQLLDDAQAQTPEAQWLSENCYKYGFILRYPTDKSDITGIIFESWHYRYVGVDAATYITQNNLCLEEYLNQQR